MSKLWVQLKPGLSPLTVNTTSRSISLIPGQAVEVEYKLYKAHLQEYVDVVMDLPKPVRQKREKKTLFPLDEE